MVIQRRLIEIGVLSDLLLLYIAITRVAKL